MKRITGISLFVIATLSATTGLIAQVPAVKANIPFNFTVGDNSLPAGEYIVSSPSSHLVKIQSADGQHSQMIIGSPNHQDVAAQGKLIFDKLGEYYFLRRILSPTTTSLNLDLTSGKVEKRVRIREARLQTEEHTLVAAR